MTEAQMTMLLKMRMRMIEAFDVPDDDARVIDHLEDPAANEYRQSRLGCARRFEVALDKYLEAPDDDARGRHYEAASSEFTTFAELGRPRAAEGKLCLVH